MCLKCKKNLCPLCKSSHDRTHYIIKYEQKFYVCLEHEENYSSFCRQCNKNLCVGCENVHSQHDIISLGKLFPNKNELDKRMIDLKENINKIRKEIKKIVEIFNAFIENLDIY